MVGIREAIAFLLSVIYMAKEEMNATDKKYSTIDGKIYEKARIEGMIAYQKHLIENLQKENAKLVTKLRSLQA